MKAAVIETYGTITLRDLPTPVMGDYDALCELLYGATCIGTDTHLIEGHAPFCHWVKPPFILGHESVGRVVKVGRKVRHYRPGDLVTRVGAPGGNGINAGWGGFAELGLAKDHSVGSDQRGVCRC
jgi:D-arabinose 1-dehydrogenase-like Zn-dependent alcohol dehydrogenase